MKLGINDTEYNNTTIMIGVILLSGIKLNVIMLSGAAPFHGAFIIGIFIQANGVFVLRICCKI
jgi:hypothetical protein